MEKQGRGRPMKYKDAAELQAACDAYFESCRGQYRRDDAGAYVLDRSGKPILDGAVPLTVSGLCLWLGFKSRQSLLNYIRRREFSAVIARARLMIENYAEQMLFDRNGYAGAAWLLSTAFGWGHSPASAEKPLPAVRVVVMDKNTPL